MGHIKYLSGEIAEAKDCYERTLSFLTDPSETHSIYLRLASIYLQDGQFSQARQTFLQACRSSPSCVSWLGVGIACYRVGTNVHKEEISTNKEYIKRSLGQFKLATNPKPNSFHAADAASLTPSTC